MMIEFEPSSRGLERPPETVLNSFSREELIGTHVPKKKTIDYERIVLFETSYVEIVFCHWVSGGKSAFHFHDGKLCWFKCLKGSIYDQREAESLRVNAGDFGYIDDKLGGHRIENNSLDCAYTLHYYWLKKGQRPHGV